MHRAPVAILFCLLLSTCLASPARAQANNKPIPWVLTGAPGVVTLVNLHPDPARRRLFSTNYQQRGLIPVCTPVEILSLNGWKAKFRVLESGEEYEYKFHTSLVEKKVAHLEKVFGTRCPREQLDALSELDRAGIQSGAAQPGMSKEGVVFAMGYPPQHQTGSLDLDEWRYWESRMRTMQVIFQDGTVSEIRK